MQNVYNSIQGILKPIVVVVGSHTNHSTGEVSGRRRRGEGEKRNFSKIDIDFYSFIGGRGGIAELWKIILGKNYTYNLYQVIDFQIYFFFFFHSTHHNVMITFESQSWGMVFCGPTSFFD